MFKTIKTDNHIKTFFRCFYINLVNKYSLDKVEKIEIENGITTVHYSDGTILIIKENAIFERGLINDNDQPLIDHCI